MGWMCIADIPLGNVMSLENVEELHVSGNQFSSIPDISFMSKLTVLRMSSNDLTTCPDLYDLPLTKLDLATNPLTCNGSLCWIRMSHWMKPELQLDAVTCATPEIYNGMRLMDIYPVELQCYKGTCTARVCVFE